MEEFKQAVVGAAEGKKSFLQISATWCGPCTQIKDEMAAFAEEFAANYDFLYCDVDKLEDVQELF